MAHPKKKQLYRQEVLERRSSVKKSSRTSFWLNLSTVHNLTVTKATEGLRERTE